MRISSSPSFRALFASSLNSSKLAINWLGELFGQKLSKNYAIEFKCQIQPTFDLAQSPGDLIVHLLLEVLALVVEVAL